MNDVQLEDCKRIGSLDFIDWEELRGASVLITGSTGLIGSNLVNILALNSQEKGLGIRLVLPVRNEEAATKLFDWTSAEIIPYALGDALLLDNDVDYVVHLASPTASRYFVEQPADTLLANIEGTRVLLEWSAKHHIKKLVTISSMEVYGVPEKGHKVRENDLGSFDTMKARNSYPIAKMACEALCAGYYKQYAVPSVVLRATQTFGPGVRYGDSRVFAELMRCVLENRDFVLKSEGLTERCYLYTADAASAVIIAMLRGRPGEAYTVANQDTYCSIRDMAHMVADQVADGGFSVTLGASEEAVALGYAETLYMDLDVEKIKALGWKPTVGLREMFERMIAGVDANA